MYADPHATKAMSASERETVASKHGAFVAGLSESPELLDGAGLDYSWNTKTLGWKPGSPSSTDGPLSDALEQLTAYYVVECANIEHALDLARQILDFHVTAVEVRPIHT